MERNRHAVSAERRPIQEARRRWADLLRRVCVVEPLPCPRCGAELRIVARITAQQVRDQIVAPYPPS